jgi:DNA invertase Pin-like site-specific DNA recombinase
MESDQDRPQLDKLMADARRRKFDVVLVWRFDRFARSSTHLLTALDEFRKLGLHFVSLHEAVDTSTPLGVMVFTIVAAVSQLEREIIRERVTAGLRRAKADGIKLGRPVAQIDAVKLQEMRQQGHSLRTIANALGVSKSTVSRLAGKVPVAS